ncbi:MAG: hypothetical protein WC942_06485, partial [Clostridia bacterium]
MSCNPVYKGKRYKNEEDAIKAILQDVEKAKTEIENINSEISSLQKETIIPINTESVPTESLEVKPEIKEIFESNLELADEVYKVLGVGKESDLSEKNIFTVEPIQSVDKK